MVALAAVQREDVVADLGCGDGRLAAGVYERIRFIHGDAFAADLRAA